MKKIRKKVIGTLFKYRSLSGDSFRHTQDIFLRNRIYLGDHKKLNDPTEGFYRNEAKIVKSGSGNYYYAEHSPLRSPAKTKAKITCFSEDPKMTLMWSHYSDFHKGICLGFKKSKLDEVSKLYRIKYNARVPISDKKSSLREKVLKGLQTKSNEWVYEKEWRIVSFVESDFVSLPPGSITQVIYGVNTPVEDIEWVQDWIKITGSKIRQRQVEFSGHAAKMHIYDYEV